MTRSLNGVNSPNQQQQQHHHQQQQQVITGENYLPAAIAGEETCPSFTYDYNLRLPNSYKVAGNEQVFRGYNYPTNTSSPQVRSDQYC